MSRKYVNEKWCVRCGKKTPTPYLQKNIGLLKTEGKTVVDVGCGNGRNTIFMRDQGFNVTPLDMCNDFGADMILGKDKFPLEDNSVDIILSNYVMMFLDEDERDQVIAEMKRVAKFGCKIMLELYAAKDSFAVNKGELIAMQREIFDKLDCFKIRYSQGKFIATMNPSSTVAS
ncbi:class I SAM-dependent methyltransferase [candidate division WWE3 bacterium]|jgi:ubiquinone/menaquinone biosynthesis C-methylase UbiE|nr:class I SAM-dependent methyltransferase [Candidatus Scalindua sp.]MBT7350036.1 class I SAM-dependent methyltransferase [candidate division WWE3 bacterium]